MKRYGFVIFTIFLAQFSSQLFAEPVYEEVAVLARQNCKHIGNFVGSKTAPRDELTLITALEVEAEDDAKIKAESAGSTHITYIATDVDRSRGVVKYTIAGYRCQATGGAQVQNNSYPSAPTQQITSTPTNQNPSFVPTGTVAIANYADVASCQIVGDVSGESRLYWTINGGLESARKEAIEKAQKGGATHVVWRAEKRGGPPLVVVGRAFNCAQAQQISNAPTPDLLTLEYQRLLSDAQQGKISYTDAFTQLDGLRSRLYPANQYLAEYFRFLGEAARKVDAKQMTYDEAEQFLEDRRQLISQKAQQAYQQQINAQVAQQLREDQSLQNQADAASEASRAAMLGLGLGILNMNNNPPPSAYPSPPVVCYWRSVLGGVQQICH